MFLQRIFPIPFLNITRAPASLIHTSSCTREKMDRKMMLRSMPRKDEGIQGAHAVDIDQVAAGKNIFPDEQTPNRLFNGIPFKDLPIVNIKSTQNNTIFNVTNASGQCRVLHTCGIEGFKNTRKGTNIAAQATAISFAQKALENGIKTVRVTVQGLGPGRMSAIKGLTMAGMEVISITDTTRVSWNPPRPRKPKRL